MLNWRTRKELIEKPVRWPNGSCRVHRSTWAAQTEIQTLA
jgi:hypothetical protein